MRNTVSSWLCLAAFSAVFTVAAAAQDGPAIVTETLARARPLLVLSPRAPEGEALAQYPVEVRVRGRISKDGRFEAPQYSIATGAGASDAAFIKSVDDVLDAWRFRPAIDRAACAATSSEALLSVYFFVEDGKPVVKLPTLTTIRAAEEKAAEGAEKLRVPTRQMVTLTEQKIVFPIHARRYGIEGAAEVLVSANADGELVETKLLYSSPIPNFGEAAMEGIKSMRMNKLEIADERERDKTYCYVIPTSFCLKERIEVPDNKCRGKDAGGVGLVLSRRPSPNSILRGF